MSSALEKLKNDLKGSLLEPESVAPRPGLTTFHSQLDQYLLWQGLPQSALTLISGAPGSGITQLFSQTANGVLTKGRWVAWIGYKDLSVQPHFFDRHHLAKLLFVEAPEDRNKLLWVIQETLSLSLFELVGCELKACSFSEGQLIQLKKLARQYGTALVFLDFYGQQRVSSSMELALELTPQRIYIQRALQRATPHSMERRYFYEDIMSKLTGSRKSISR